MNRDNDKGKVLIRRSLDGWEERLSFLVVCRGGCERRRVAGRLWLGSLRFYVFAGEVVSVGALLDACS